MAVVLVPLAALAWLVEWSRALRLGAALLVLLFGLWKLADPRHPRALARIPPSRLAWWSFLMATAHGAGLMLVPFMLRLCEAPPLAAGGMERAHGRVMGGIRALGWNSCAGLEFVRWAGFVGWC